MNESRSFIVRGHHDHASCAIVQLSAGVGRTIAEGMSCVQSLGLAHVREVSDDALCLLAEFLWIEHLDLAYCLHATDAGLAAIAEASSGLLSLNISWCRKLTDASLDALASGCRHLETLTAIACDQLSDAAFARLQAAVPLLKIMRVEVQAVELDQGRSV